MEKITSYVYVGVMALLIVVTIVNIFTKIFSKKKHNKSEAENENEKESQTEYGTNGPSSELDSPMLKLVKNIIPNAMELAEQSGVIGPSLKRLIALSNINLACNQEGIDYTANLDFIIKTVEDLISFSKCVNAKKAENKPIEAQESQAVEQKPLENNVIESLE